MAFFSYISCGEKCSRLKFAEAETDIFQMAAPTSSAADDQEHCITCNLIKMGSATTYSDGTCPQCGNTVIEE